MGETMQQRRAARDALRDLREQGYRIDWSREQGLYRFRFNRVVIVSYSPQGLLDAIRDFLALGLV